MGDVPENDTGMWLPDPVRADIAHIIQEVRFRWWDSTKSQWTNYLFVKKTPNSEGTVTSDSLTPETLNSLPAPSSADIGGVVDGDISHSARKDWEKEMTELLLKADGYTSVTQLSEEEIKKFDDTMEDFRNASESRQKSLLSLAKFFKDDMAGEPRGFWGGSPTTRYYYLFIQKAITIGIIVFIFVTFVRDAAQNFTDSALASVGIVSLVGAFLTFSIWKSIKTLRRQLRAIEVEKGTL